MIYLIYLSQNNAKIWKSSHDATLTQKWHIPGTLTKQVEGGRPSTEELGLAQNARHNHGNHCPQSRTCV